jgi:hypothetical protein
MLPRCEPYFSASKPTQSFVKQPQSIKQQEQLELYHAFYNIHKKAQEIDKLVTEVTAKMVLSTKH